MRKERKEEFSSFTIESNRWAFTCYDRTAANNYFRELSSGTLYGNRADGSRKILASK